MCSAERFHAGKASDALRTLGFAFDYPTPDVTLCANSIEYLRFEESIRQANDADPNLTSFEDLWLRASEIAQSNGW